MECLISKDGKPGPGPYCDIRCNEKNGLCVYSPLWPKPPRKEDK